MCSPEGQNLDTARNLRYWRASLGMNHPKKELAEAERDLAESKKVLRIAKNKAKAAKGGKLERNKANAF
jgi:translation elongation factor EF-Ts